MSNDFTTDFSACYTSSVRVIASVDHIRPCSGPADHTCNVAACETGDEKITEVPIDFVGKDLYDS